MKRLILLVVVFFQILLISSQTKKFSRWSFAPEYGYNMFDGDINQLPTNVIPTSVRDITLGGTVEYAFSPVWGLALDAYYFPLRAVNTTPIPIYVNTDLYTSSLNATINFTRWIFPQTRSKFYINGAIGIGYSTYIYDVRYNTGTSANPVMGTPLAGADINNFLIFQGGVPLKQGYAVTIPVTFSFEYNFSDPVSLGAKLHYRSYNKDNLEGVTQLNYKGVTNDFIGAGTLFLRYKFHSKSKNHLRNITWDVFQPDEGLVLAKEIGKKLDKLKNRVDTIAAKVDSLMPRVARLENMLSNDGPDSDGDGVPDIRDLSPNTPANTAVDFWGRPLAISNNNASPMPVSTNGNATSPANTVKGSTTGGNNLNSTINWDDIPAVYFDFDRIDLDNPALITISKIAAKLKADPTLFVEVRGYCDYMGNSPYNNLLSQRRSDRVKSELVKIWGIPFDHVISNGKGKVLEPRIKYRPNRRCDFFFGKL